MNRRETKVFEKLLASQKRLHGYARKAAREGTIWEHAYALGKRDGMRLAMEHVSGEPQSHRDGLLDQHGAPSEEDD